jgi:hypothetical protein
MASRPLTFVSAISKLRDLQPLEGDRVRPYGSHTGWEAAFGTRTGAVPEPSLHGITRDEELPWRIVG